MSAVIRLEKEMCETCRGDRRRGFSKRSGNGNIIKTIIINLRYCNSNKSDPEEELE
jgi:hypothetical protein